MPPVITLGAEFAGVPSQYRFISGMFTVGREQGNDIVVPSNAVSRQHAKVIPAGNHWVYCDLGSTNGSWINDQPITPHKLVLLRAGDNLTIADSKFEVSLRSDSNSSGPRYAKSLLVFKDDSFVSEFSMENPNAVFCIGGAGGHVHLPGQSKSGPEHVEIRTDELQFYVVMLELATAVLLNGSPLKENSPVGDSDELRIGPFTILVNQSERTVSGIETGEQRYDAPLPPAIQRYTDMPLTSITEPHLAAYKGPTGSQPWDDEPKGGDSGRLKRFIFNGEEGSGPRAPYDGGRGTVAISNLDRTAMGLSTGGLSTGGLSTGGFAGGFRSRQHQDPADHAGFEMSISRRVSNAPPAPTASPGRERNRRVMMGVAFIAISLMLGLGIVLLLVLN